MSHRMTSTHLNRTRQRLAYPLRRLRTRDRGLLALRRAARTAVVMPAMFALGDKVIGNAEVATFAAFGSFAMLMFVDFGGPMIDRLQAQASLAVVGAVFVCVGTLTSRNPWLAAVAMGLVGFGVLFVGVVSSTLAGATTSLLLAFILPVSLPGAPSSIPERLAGWAMASIAGMAAVALLWPAPAEDQLRVRATATCRALAARLRLEVARLLDGEDTGTAAECEQTTVAADSAVAELHQLFLATPYRPTGLSTTARAVVRLVDELNWLHSLLTQSRTPPPGAVNPAPCAVKIAAAAVLERGADLLETPRTHPESLRSALAELRQTLAVLEHNATSELPIQRERPGESAVMAEQRIREFIGSLDPSFRAQELSFVVSLIGSNIDLAASADRRRWIQRILGRQPTGLPGTLSAAQERAAAHVERHSLWLHNSVRGAVGLALAVFVAGQTGVEHSFWVVLGTLSVLRSNALNTGQNVLRAVGGTAVGFAVGAALLVPIGRSTTLLWFLLPLTILLAGVAPSVISFAAGQAGFTLVLVILFNIIQPTGWRVGLLRVEDIALGCAVSLLVGVLFWPRGAAAALSKSLAEAYADSASYLAAAVEFGMLRCDPSTPSPVGPAQQAVRAAAASRRMDDTFRGYLAERGAKSIPLAEVTRLVTGVAGLRLAADAVLDLWGRDDGRAAGDRAAARLELLRSTESIRGWYDDLAYSLNGVHPVPAPLPQDRDADGRLLQAVRHDLRGEDGQATATAVRMIWTSDHLDAARRLQTGLVQPASAVHHGK
jgi:uncharacterized membrane protein YccC